MILHWQLGNHIRSLQVEVRSHGTLTLAACTPWRLGPAWTDVKMGILGTKLLGLRLSCLNVCRSGRFSKGWRFYTASKNATDAPDAVKSVSESSTENPPSPSMLQRRPYVHWTPEELHQAYKLLDDGLTHGEVAARLPGRSLFQVSNMVQRRAQGGGRAWGSRVPYDREEVQKLYDLRKSGASYKEMMEMLPSRTLPSVKKKLKNLDALIATGARDISDLEKWRSGPWTAEETTHLLDLAQQGLTMTQVAGRLKRTVQSIEHRYRQLRATNEAWPSFPTWTPQETAELRRMKSAGFLMKVIAAKLHRPKTGCEKQWLRIMPRNADGSIQRIDGVRRPGRPL